MGRVQREAACGVDARRDQNLQRLGGVVAQPVGGAGVDVDADVGQGAEDVRGVPDQLGRELLPTRRAQGERPVRLQHQRHVRGTDPGGELVDPLLVVPLLLARR